MERIEWRNVRIKLCHNATRARKTSCHLMLIMYAGDMQLPSGQIHGGEKHKQVTWRRSQILLKYGLKNGMPTFFK